MRNMETINNMRIIRVKRGNKVCRREESSRSIRKIIRKSIRRSIRSMHTVQRNQHPPLNSSRPAYEER